MDMITAMARKLKLLSEQLRDAILNADVSRYRMARDIGVTEALLSRFINGGAGLGQATIDKVGKYLGLQLVASQKLARKTKAKNR
jgi:plasmid maintenance system antidote protein VapI